MTLTAPLRAPIDRARPLRVKVNTGDTLLAHDLALALANRSATTDAFASVSLAGEGAPPNRYDLIIEVRDFARVTKDDLFWKGPLKGEARLVLSVSLLDPRAGVLSKVVAGDIFVPSRPNPSGPMTPTEAQIDAAAFLILDFVVNGREGSAY